MTRKTVAASQITNEAMRKGNEHRITKIIHDDVLKEWVGIGWIDKGTPTAEDRRLYPKVI